MLTICLYTANPQFLVGSKGGELKLPNLAMDGIHMEHEAVTYCNPQRRNHLPRQSHIACVDVPSDNPEPTA